MSKRIPYVIIVFLIASNIFADEWRSVPVNIAFTHGLSIGEAVSKDDEKIVSNVMLNVLTGKVDSINGIVLGGLINQTTYGISGIELAGLGNISDGKLNGVQVAGLFNTSKNYQGVQLSGVASVGDTGMGIQASGVTNISNDNLGVQLAGINNVNKGASQGIQAAGICNNSRTSEGTQFAGITNVTLALNGAQGAGIYNHSGDVTGVQGAGIGNRAANLTGVQGAGIANVARDVTGVQGAGISNVAGNITGIQAAGITNVADSVDGVQVGLFNYAESNSGVALGLVSIVKDYAPGFMAWSDDQLFINAALRTGTRKLYNLLFVSVRPDDKPYLGVGSGLGTRFGLTDNFSLDLDATAQWIVQQEELNSTHFLNHFQSRVRLFADFKLVREFGIFAGPTFTTTVSEGNEVIGTLKDRSGIMTRKTDQGNTVALTPGIVFGVRIN